VYTYRFLKKHNVFGYNDVVTLVPNSAGDYPVPHNTPMTLITRSRSGSQEANLSNGPQSPQRHHPHNSFMDNIIGSAETLAEATGHGLLGGKIRKTQLYPSMSAGEVDLTKIKKGI
jgi:hypothetical protein